MNLTAVCDIIFFFATPNFLNMTLSCPCQTARMPFGTGEKICNKAERDACYAKYEKDVEFHCPGAQAEVGDISLCV